MVEENISITLPCFGPQVTLPYISVAVVRVVNMV